jgi:hypothetical protein
LSSYGYYANLIIGAFLVNLTSNEPDGLASVRREPDSAEYFLKSWGCTQGIIEGHNPKPEEA